MRESGATKILLVHCVRGRAIELDAAYWPAFVRYRAAIYLPSVRPSWRGSPAKIRAGKNGYSMMYASPRPFADPEKAARLLLAIAKGGRSTLRRSTGRFCYKAWRNIGAGINLAIERGWLVMHESGTFVTLAAGSDLR
ncbi:MULTISPECIES: hypothetical protein [unclassified Bradyrhizobium]|uniref:hypothetical protein n=1 Tax=unclassified Bradyrhizobium TaxID=2631580 RepID=UPI002FEFA416